MRPIVNMSEEHQATDTGNMHKKMVKIARVVPEISSRKTDRQAYSSQYFVTRMWANAQPDGRPAGNRWRPLFNAAKFG